MSCYLHLRYKLYLNAYVKYVNYVSIDLYLNPQKQLSKSRM